MTRAWSDAIGRDDVDALSALVEAGADVNSRDRHGQSGLMVAARDGRRQAVRFLVARGADLNHTAKFGLSATMLAVVNGHVEIVRSLAQAGAALDIQGRGAPGFAGKTALDLAEARNDAEMVAALRERTERS